MNHSVTHRKNRKFNLSEKTDMEIYKWLFEILNDGSLRIKTLSWERLIAIYKAALPTSYTRKVIAAERRHCGYDSIDAN